MLGFSSKEKSNETEKNKMILPLLPLRDIVIFPHMVAPLFVGREKSIQALENAMGMKKDLFLAAQRDAKKDEPGEKDIEIIGTIGNILQLLRLSDGTVKLLVEGKRRGRITQFLPHKTFFLAEVEEIVEGNEHNLEMEALIRSVRSTFEEYVKFNKKIPSEVVLSVSSIDDASRICDTIAAHLTLRLADKQELLEAFSAADRLEKVYRLMRAEIEVGQIEQRIKDRVKKQMEKTQKEYYLSEQMRAIQKEMGAKDDHKNELNELEQKIKRKRMPKEAMAKVRHEFKKLKMMSPMSAEATVVRNYIDWLISLPWYDKSKSRIDINDAEQILDDDHYGLKKPKERIIEYLAVQSLVKKIKGPILCLVGPPGVGKTSLARSVARATRRNFIRLSLGGVRDEAEIRGHRRTYIGAMPGKIIQSLRKAKTNNPVFCLDEVDKMSMDFRGDPSAALLEVLDPEQNYAFNDHYLDVDYDLSEILFITTANTLHSIPAPLQDRMEIIHLPGYTEEEKLNIARQFLLPKQIEANGLKTEDLEITDNAILGIVRRYTKEAGVRNLERELSTICRKVAKEVAKKPEERHKTTVNAQSLEKYFGVPRYRYGLTEEKDEIGVATGLAWTEFGGDILQIEAVTMPGKGNLTITGKLGDVMQESARAAVSYVRSRAEQLGLDTDFYQKLDIHIHVPEGAIPKDGPSAGITMATAITSALLKIPVRKDIAMTGEITLRGRVLPIGGLKEKLLAAKRANVNMVLIPAENEKDLKEISPKLLKSIRVAMVESMDAVLKQALVLEDTELLFKKPQTPPVEVFPEEQAVAEITAH
ncbi:MAG: endopeptidase La [Pseudomonadota bacterium]